MRARQKARATPDVRPLEWLLGWRAWLLENRTVDLLGRAWFVAGALAFVADKLIGELKDVEWLTLASLSVMLLGLASMTASRPPLWLVKVSLRLKELAVQGPRSGARRGREQRELRLSVLNEALSLGIYLLDAWSADAWRAPGWPQTLGRAAIRWEHRTYEVILDHAPGYSALFDFDDSPMLAEAQRHIGEPAERARLRRHVISLREILILVNAKDLY